MQSFSNFVGLFLAPSLMNLCNKIGIGWTNFFAVAMVTKKGGFLLKFDFLLKKVYKHHDIDV